MIPARSNIDELITEPMNPFDSVAADYDAWFDGKGKLVFTIEAQAIGKMLLYLPRPWLEIGVGSGRFAEIMEMEYGLDISIPLLQFDVYSNQDPFPGKLDEIFQPFQFVCFNVCDHGNTPSRY